MKYSEFKREVGKFGYESIGTLGKTRIYVMNNKNGEKLMDISTLEPYQMNTFFDEFNQVEPFAKVQLFNLAKELASTPLDEREDERRYRLKLNLPFISEYSAYLNYDKDEDEFIISDGEDLDTVKTIFTETEIEELKAKHNLDSFVMEEVKEDE